MEAGRVNQHRHWMTAQWVNHVQLAHKPLLRFDALLV